MRRWRRCARRGSTNTSRSARATSLEWTRTTQGITVKPMVPGMIFTVEPGIIDTQKNIVIHVEDMILVTPTGHKNLSESIPIEVGGYGEADGAEVERTRARSRPSNGTRMLTNDSGRGHTIQLSDTAARRRISIAARRARCRPRWKRASRTTSRAGGRRPRRGTSGWTCTSGCA